MVWSDIYFSVGRRGPNGNGPRYGFSGGAAVVPAARANGILLPYLSVGVKGESARGAKASRGGRKPAGADRGAPHPDAWSGRMAVSRN